MEMQDYVLGMDIGGTNIRAGLVDRRYHLTGYQLVSSTFLQESDSIERLADFIRLYLSQELPGEKPLAISAGFPSSLDKTRKKLLSTPNIHGLDNVDMVDRLEEALGIRVFINRDVNMLFQYDCVFHHLDTSGLLIGCYLGTGIGNVISINGEIITGKNGCAAEMGHIPLFGVKKICSCGNVGCSETMASGWRLKEIQEELFPETPIADIFTRYLDAPVIQGFIDVLAQVITTEINLLDPDYIILGGGLLIMDNFPMKLLEERIHFFARKPLPEGNLQIIYSDPGQENGVIGAGIHAYKELQKEL